MKKKYLILISLFYLSSSGQSKFVGKFAKLLHFKDTLEKQEYLFNKRFVIKHDFTYTYVHELNMPYATKNNRESITGSWKSNGDTIIFYNKGFAKPKGVQFIHTENQNFDGIKIKVKDGNGKLLKTQINTKNNCSINGKTITLKPIEVVNNIIQITDTSYSEINFEPEGFCKKVEGCPIVIGLKDIKNGTLIEVICYSTEIEIRFEEKKYRLQGNILIEIPTVCYLPYGWTDMFIRTK